MNDTAGDFIASAGSATQAGTTGATTNAIVKATAANTLGDSSLKNPATGTIEPIGGDLVLNDSASVQGLKVTTSDLKIGNENSYILRTGAGYFYSGDSGVSIGVRSDRGLGTPGAGYLSVIAGSGNNSFTYSAGYCVAASDAQYGFCNVTSVGASAADTGLGRSAAGIAKITDGSTGQGALLAKRVITAKTSDYTVTAAETGTVFTNTGAAGTVVFTLPASPANGLTYEFHVTAAQSVDIKTGTAVLIYANAAATTATTGKLTKNTVGTCIQLTYNGVAWMGTGQSGTWTVS